ncbi:MAG: hypothetical protein NZ918_03805 [Aigarchaeota archaeon]|nr:hypothetical protein [Aigarchaeota archaeon]
MRKTRRLPSNLKPLVITPNDVLRLLKPHKILINRLLMLTEDGTVIFQFRLDHDTSILAYILAKALLYGLRISKSYDVSIDELLRIPSIDSNALRQTLDRFSHESEKLILMSGRGYCLNPNKEKIREIVDLIEDYLMVSGQGF